MKKFTLISILIFTIISSFIQAQTTIIPESESNVESYVSGVSVGGEVWKNYNNTLKEKNLSLGEQLASGIISRDTILDYCAYLVKFLGEVALLVGALAIIYIGYKRILKNVIGDTPKGLLLVIIGLLIIIFAYAIIKLLRSAFIS